MRHPHTVLGWPLAVALLGLIFCLFSVQGYTEAICTTEGCALYRDLTIFGASLWAYGLIAFGLFGVLALLGRIRLGLTLATLALLCDTVLLGILFITAPCSNCLIVATLLGLNFLAYLSAARRSGIPGHRLTVPVLLLWFLFFFPTVCLTAKQSFARWPVLGERDAAVHLFFSPTCPRCQDAVRFYSGRLGVAFYPVCEAPEDLEKICVMYEELQKGSSIKDALETALQRESQGDRFDRFSRTALLLGVQTLLNRSYVLHTESPGVPFLEYRGLPRLVQKELERQRKAQKKAAERNRTDTGVTGDTQPAPADNRREPAPVTEPVGTPHDALDIQDSRNGQDSRISREPQNPTEQKDPQLTVPSRDPEKNDSRSSGSHEEKLHSADRTDRGADTSLDGLLSPEVEPQCTPASCN